MKSIMLSASFLFLSASVQAASCQSVKIDDLFEELPENASSTIRTFLRNTKTMTGGGGAAIYSDDDSLLLVSNGDSFRKHVIGIFQVNEDNYKKLGEINTTRTYTFHCFGMKGDNLEITNRSNDKRWRYSESFNIKAYTQKMVTEMKSSFIASKSSIAELNSFIDRFEPVSVIKETDLLLSQAEALRDSLIEDRYQNEFKVAKDINTLSSLYSYINKYPNTTKKEETIDLIYELVNKENNVIGYKWFIDHYRSSDKSRSALKKIHEIAFTDASNIGTIEAYNDFIVTYPFSVQREEAENLAYDLESQEYSSYFTSDEKLARTLSIKAKQIKRKGNELNNNAYLLVVARMTRLLENKFPSEQSTERHLENEEILGALNRAVSELKQINLAANKIANNTSNLSFILKEQSKMMDNHFKNAAQDRKLADKYTKDHRNWERYLSKQEL